ncbi:MAG TPA: phosphatase PAP2 family protein [Chthoniobacterales bacterium]|nr:phosphatase PAP2 family protein [Chthoniobacterales bacterium]
MNRKTILLWAVAVLIVAALIAGAFWLDEPVRQFFLQHRSRALYRAMRQVSRFGDWPEHLAVGLILIGIAWWRGSKTWMRIFLAMIIALALAGVTARVIKIACGRARPSVKTEQVVSRFSAKYQAFPSGHVAASSAFFGVLLVRKRRIGVICMIIPAVIGFSRMYVAAHYLSDVVCAAILGVVCAFVVLRCIMPRIGNSQSGKLAHDRPHLRRL